MSLKAFTLLQLYKTAFLQNLLLDFALVKVILIIETVTHAYHSRLSINNSELMLHKQLIK